MAASVVERAKTTATSTKRDNANLIMVGFVILFSIMLVFLDLQKNR